MSEHSEAHTLTFQRLLHSRQPLRSSLCPLYMVKAILTVCDKHRPNTSKQEVRDEQGFSQSTHASLAAMSCLYTREVAGSHVSPALVAAAQSAAVTPVYPVVKNSVQCAVGLLCIFSGEGLRCYKQEKEGNKSDRQSQAWDLLFPGYFMPRSLSEKPSPLSLSLSTDVT